MRQLWSTTSKITKDKNEENIPYLETTEVVLIHCNVGNRSYWKILGVVYICS